MSIFPRISFCDDPPEIDISRSGKPPRPRPCRSDLHDSMTLTKRQRLRTAIAISAGAVAVIELCGNSAGADTDQHEAVQLRKRMLLLVRQMERYQARLTSPKPRVATLALPKSDDVS